MIALNRYDSIVVGAGFSGLSAATALAQAGRNVVVVERHASAGGRAREFQAEGFRFDMGPSWYWMPDVFEEWFIESGSTVDTHLDLIRLDPSYRTWFSDGPVDVPAGLDAVRALFEQLEPGSGQAFDRFFAEAERKYRLGMDRFVRSPGHSPLELMDLSVIPGLRGLDMFRSLSGHVRKYFSDPRIIQLLEFPVLFLGARAENTPALYSLMNHADTALGTWYPKGGMHRIVEAMVDVARSSGVEFLFDAEVAGILEQGGRATGVRLTSGREIHADSVVAATDYHHAEQSLLPRRWRRYSEKYWRGRVMAPSSMLYYLGVEARLDALEHHNLFFDVPFGPHAQDIYDDPAWPENPLFYVCAPSRTDPTVAPEGCENLFVLVPLAPGLEDGPVEREALFNRVMDRLETHIGSPVRSRLIYRRDYAMQDFRDDYHAFKGNAYGLANTLRQTAFLKPKMKSRLAGLFFAGQLTTPGPGVPPSLISGRMAAGEAHAFLAESDQVEVPIGS